MMFQQTMMETAFGHCSFSPLQRPHQTAMNTGKRGRDSETDDTDSIDGRPLKRPFLAIGRSGSNFNSANSSRQGSEDWVHAAGGLSIDSPLYTPSAVEGVSPLTIDGAVTEGGSIGEDVDMLIESEETCESGTSRPAQTSFNSRPGQPISSFTDTPDERTPRRHNYGTRYVERMHTNTLPEIDITPATPVHTMPYGHQYFGAQQLQAVPHVGPLAVPSSPQELSDAMPMTLSPPPTHAETLHGSKRRIAFGPRANCEKCRLRIPGHFVHYD